jgi:hypothetical protein
LQQNCMPAISARTVCRRPQNWQSIGHRSPTGSAGGAPFML